MERWMRWVHEQVFLLLALAAAAVTALLIFRFLAAADQKVAVVVASRDIAPGTEITAGMIREVSIHPSGLHPEAATGAGLAVGRFSLVPVHQGEQILLPQLSSDESKRGYLAEMSDTQRAMLVPVNLTRGLGGAVADGDRVDVIFVPNEQKMGRSGVATVLEDALVLDVRDDRGLSRQTAEDRDSGFLGVLLAVQPEQAERLAFYVEHGQLFLTLAGFRAAPSGRSETAGLVLPVPAGEQQGLDELQPVDGLLDMQDVPIHDSQDGGDVSGAPAVTP